MASTDSKSGEGAVVNVNASNPVAMTDHKAGPKESEVNVKNDQIMHGAQGARQDEGKAYGVSAGISHTGPAHFLLLSNDQL